MQRGNCGRNNYDADLRAVALIVFDHKFAVGGGGQSFRLVKGAPRSVLKGSENRHEHCGLCVECAETRHQAIKPSRADGCTTACRWTRYLDECPPRTARTPASW
jgi:hypothetical protein